VLLGVLAPPRIAEITSGFKWLLALRKHAPRLRKPTPERARSAMREIKRFTREPVGDYVERRERGYGLAQGAREFQFLTRSGRAGESSGGDEISVARPPLS
jgi:hypothetical protein